MNRYIVLAVDPGTRGSGAAVFQGGVLTAATYVKNPAPEGNKTAECCMMAQAIKVWFDTIVYAGVDGAEATFVCEWPQVRHASHQKGSKKSADPNDLLALAGVDVGVAMLLPRAEHLSPTPSAWKDGNLDKEVMCRRVWKRLSADEQIRVARTPRGGGLHFEGVEGGIRHDTLDAAGIGLWHLGRLERVRVIP